LKPGPERTSTPDGWNQENTLKPYYFILWSEMVLQSLRLFYLKHPGISLRRIVNKIDLVRA
jgi:hypothetical protein